MTTRAAERSERRHSACQGASFWCWSWLWLFHRKRLDVRTPCAVDVAGQRHPDPLVRPQPVDLIEQPFVDRLGALQPDIIGVDGKAQQPMTGQDALDLLPPHGQRIVLQDVKQALVLDRRQGQL